MLRAFCMPTSSRRNCQKWDGDVRNGNEMVTGMKAKYTQNLYKIHLSLAYVKKK